MIDKRAKIAWERLAGAEGGKIPTDGYIIFYLEDGDKIVVSMSDDGNGIKVRTYMGYVSIRPVASNVVEVKTTCV